MGRLQERAQAPSRSGCVIKEIEECRCVLVIKTGKQQPEMRRFVFHLNSREQCPQGFHLMHPLERWSRKNGWLWGNGEALFVLRLSPRCKYCCLGWFQSCQYHIAKEGVKNRGLQTIQDLLSPWDFCLLSTHFGGWGLNPGPYIPILPVRVFYPHK